MAGDYLATPLLLAMGLDEFSVSANSIHQIKYVINQLALQDANGL